MAELLLVEWYCQSRGCLSILLIDNRVLSGNSGNCGKTYYFQKGMLAILMVLTFFLIAKNMLHCRAAFYYITLRLANTVNKPQIDTNSMVL